MSWRHLLCATLLLAWLAPIARADFADEQYLAAATHFTQGRWTQAREALLAFLATYPQHLQGDQARFYLAESHVQLQEYPLAAEQFEKLLAQQAPSAIARKALYRAGEAQYFARNNPAAQVHLKKFLNQFPSDPLNAYVLAYLGEIELESGAIDKATAFFNEGLERFPEGALSGDCRLGLARVMEKSNKLEEARRLYAETASRAGELADDAQLRLASSYYEHEEYREATQAYQEFVTRFPDSPLLNQARLGLAQAAFQNSDDVRAEAAYAELALDSPLAAAARYGLGLTQMRRGAWLLAASSFERSLEIESPPAQREAALVLAGECRLQAEQVQAARELFLQAEQEFPKGERRQECALGKLNCSAALGEHEQVVEQATALLSQDPKHPRRLTITLHYARALLVLERGADVVTLLKPVTGAYPAANESPRDRHDRLLVHYLLATVYQAQRREAEALAALKPLAESDDPQLLWTRQDAWRLRAAIYLRQEKFAEARDALEHFLEQPIIGTESTVLAQLAICQTHLRDAPAADQTYFLFLASEPSDELRLLTLEALHDAARRHGDARWSAELAALKPRVEEPIAATNVRFAAEAWELYEAGKLSEAERQFAAALTRSPQIEGALEAALLRARILLALEREADALQVYAFVRDQYSANPSTATLLVQVVKQLEQQGRHSRAASVCEQMIVKPPRGSSADEWLYDSAWSWKQAGKLAHAQSLFDRLRVEHPESRYRADATFRLAELALADNRPADARRWLDEVFTLPLTDTLKPHALFLRAQLDIDQNKWSEAAKSLDQLSSAYPDHALRSVVDFWRAECCYRQQNYDVALVRFRALHDAIDDETASWAGVVLLREAQLLARQKEFDKAQEIAEQIASKHPQFEQQHEVDYLLGRCASAQAEFNAAREYYQRVVRSPVAARSEIAAMAQWMIAESFFHQREYATAVSEYQKVETQHSFPTWQALALLQMGKCHEQVGNWTAATDVYARLVKTFPSSSHANEAASRLQAAREQALRK